MVRSRPSDVTSAPGQDGSARSLPRRLPPGGESRCPWRVVSEVRSLTLGVEPQRRCVRRSREEGRWREVGRSGKPRHVGRGGAAERRERRTDRGGGVPGGHVGGVPPRVRASCPWSHFVTHFPPRNHVGRKRCGRAQQSWRAATPSLWGPGADRPTARTPPYAGPPSLHSLPGPHSWRSQEGTCELVCAETQIP